MSNHADFNAYNNRFYKECIDDENLLDLVLDNPRSDFNCNVIFLFTSKVKDIPPSLIRLLKDPRITMNNPIMYDMFRIGNDELVKYMIENVEGHEMNKIWECIRRNFVDLFEKLLSDQNFDVSQSFNSIAKNCIYNNRMTMYRKVIANPMYRVSQEVLSTAASCGYVDICEELFKNPAMDIHSIASSVGNADILKLILKYPNVNVIQYTSDLFGRATLDGDIDLLKVVLGVDNVDVNILMTHILGNATPLCGAIRFNRYRMVELILHDPRCDPCIGIEAEIRDFIRNGKIAIKQDILRLLMTDGRVLAVVDTAGLRVAVEQYMS